MLLSGVKRKSVELAAGRRGVRLAHQELAKTYGGKKTLKSEEPASRRT